MDNTKLEYFKFENIEYGNQNFIVHYEIKNKYKSNYDFDCVDDVVTVRDIIIDYLKQHPSNEINGSKIFISLGKENVESVMSVTNYTDYYSQNEPCSVNDFNYYTWLYVKELSSLERLGPSVKSLWVYADNIDSVDFLQNWDELEYLRIQSADLSEKESKKAEILEMFDTFNITQNDDRVLEIEKNTVQSYENILPSPLP
ncbi:MAG: hypothetical protein K2K57_00080 [Oscillospiraceae bacterium]|nr:hypothetical protein [Oscillospiraceae bacterium]